MADNPRMRLRFTKMQGAGNDFVMLDGIAQPFALDRAQLRLLADRRFGVGADQILLVERPDSPTVDFKYRIFNADGDEVEACGNGARCFVKFVHARGLTSKRTIRVQTAGGVIEPMLEADGDVTVDMGPPQFEPTRVPFDGEGLVATARGRARLWPLDVNGMVRDVVALSMGNPHAVQQVVDVDAAPVTLEGPTIEHHPRFPRRVNAGFMQVLDRHTIKLRVWERGAGETLACGTGACAAAVAGISLGELDSPVTVHARGGRLRIAWDGHHSDGPSPVRMTGPATTVFEGEIDL
jgi:diaminopimelate epimerase